MALRPLQKDLLGLLGWLLACFAAAAIGALASVEAGSFYAVLNLPWWAPPANLFGPVWTLLYATMALAAWLVWRGPGGRGKTLALALFVAQLGLNALWSWLFFAWRLGGPAFAGVLLLALAIGACLAAFWRQRPLAGALLVPYLLWVGFAAALNLAAWQLNPGVL